MKKTAVEVLGITLLILLVAYNFSSVSALSSGTYTDHQNAYGETVIDIDGHPLIIFDAFHYDSGAFGAGDVIRIWRYWEFSGPTGPISQWLPVAIITDMPQRIDLFQVIYKGYPTSIQLVGHSNIQVCRISKTVMAVWTRALEVPDEYWGLPGTPKVLVPAMIIPAGMLVFGGHGDAISNKEDSGGQPPKLYSQTIIWTGYYADAALVCLKWHFIGCVGVNEGTHSTVIRTDATVTTTIN